jgi:hypothetical protein
VFLLALVGLYKRKDDEWRGCGNQPT